MVVLRPWGHFFLLYFLGRGWSGGGDPAALPVNNECSIEGDNLS